MRKIYLKSSKRLPGQWWVRKMGPRKYPRIKYFATWDDALKYALTLLSVLLLFCLPVHALPFHNLHRSQVVKDTLSELRLAARVVGEYQRNPPYLTDAHADDMYVTRAEADINIAMGALVKYKHHHCAEQDVRTAVSQLERDLEDIPPAHWPVDTRAKV